MFNGPKPQGQARSLRSITESKTSAGGFPPPTPVPEETYPFVYHDAAAAQPNALGPRPITAADPQPFSNVRGGK